MIVYNRDEEGTSAKSRFLPSTHSSPSNPDRSCQKFQTLYCLLQALMLLLHTRRRGRAFAARRIRALHRRHASHQSLQPHNETLQVIRESRLLVFEEERGDAFHRIAPRL